MLNDKADITATCTLIPPNDFGLYNMAGNVNEWVNDTLSPDDRLKKKMTLTLSAVPIHQ